MEKTDTWLYPLPRPDVVWTNAPLLPAPEQTDGGRCFCCHATCHHRFLLPESSVLTPVARAMDDVRGRLERATATLDRLNNAPRPGSPAAQKRQTAALDAARNGLLQAQLAARRMALRHIPHRQITLTSPLSAGEHDALSPAAAPFALCAFCHAWHALNGAAAAQGVMVWLPDLHPASVVALNRQTLKAILTGSKSVRREGKAVLSALLQSRVAVEERYRSWRPVDFADVLRRHPPSQRDALRNNMQGLALVLTPDAFPESAHLS